MSAKGSTLDSLQEKGWVLAKSNQPLGSLQLKNLDSYKLVILLGPKNRTGATYFQIFLQDDSGHISSQPIIIGLNSHGKYPGYNWIEISHFTPRVSFGSGEQFADISIDALTQRLFQYLADLIPPGAI